MNSKFQKESRLNNDEININLNFLLNQILRNKIFIGSISLISIFTFLIYGTLRKKIWSGEFEIVLDNKSNIQTNDPLSALVAKQFDSGEKTLNTEVRILQSPSVLLPVYEFVKRNYRDKDKDYMEFSKWIDKNLDIKLIKQTSVLSISYNDENKDLVLPVLEKISKEYQKYSGKNKRRNFEISKSFLDEQILIYKNKTAESLRNVQDFAINQNLNFFNQSETKDEFPTNTSIEIIRSGAANKIRNIDIQINKVKELKNEIKEIQYLGVVLPALKETGIPQLLQNIEIKLAELTLKYNEDDLSIKKLKAEREKLISLLKEKAIGYLKAERIINQALMESAERPKSVILKYKELLREASRDEDTLVKLENNLRSLNLARAKYEDPWELITKPTLKPYPLGFPKIYYLVLGGFLGSLFGISLSLIKERFSGLIYESQIISELIGKKVLGKINFNTNQKDLNNQKNLLKEIFSQKKENSFVFVTSGNVNSSYINQFKNEYLKENKNLFIEDDFSKIKNDKDIILIAVLGEIKYIDIETTKARLSSKYDNLYGIILIET